MTTVRLAVRMAFSPDSGQRWRQFSVVMSALLAVLFVAATFAVVSASDHVVRTLDHRAPIATADGDKAAFQISQRGIDIGGREVCLLWIQPVAGHETDPDALPPGLARLPAPGEGVVSPGLAHRGVTAESLGFRTSDAGLGPGHTIGRQGVGTADELIAWIRPPAGRTLGDGGVLLSFTRFPTSNDLAGGASPGYQFTPEPLIPRGGQLALLVFAFALLPALIMAGLGARARSEVRAARSEFLIRLGIQPWRVRTLLAVEGGLLGLVGVLLGLLIYAVGSPWWTIIPLSGTRVFPGGLTLSAETLAAAAALVLAVVVVVAGGMRLAASTRQRRARRAGVWRAVLVLVGAAVLVANNVLGINHVLLLYAGILMLAVALPLATPYLAQVVALRTAGRRRSAGWLAARRVGHFPFHTSRTASVLALCVYLGATSVSIFAGPLAGGTDSGSTTALKAAAYYADWRDARPGDLTALQRSVGADGQSVVLPITGQVSSEASDVITIPDCSALDPVRTALGGPACDRDGRVSDRVQALFRDTFHAKLAIGRAEDGAVVDSAIILSARPLSDVEVYRLGSGLPAFNPADLQATMSMWSALGGWILAGWMASFMILSLTILRELIESSRAVHRDGEVLVRLGLARSDAERVGRWTLLIPILAAVPVAYLCGLLTSFYGRNAEITRYTPVWISEYTALVLLTSMAAVGAGTLLSRTRRRG